MPLVSARVRGAAHPRSRGENFICSAGLPRMNGSSPLTRGKQGRNRTCLKLTRLIPAHAGKTRTGAPARCEWSAHPRSRGENFLTALDAPELAGSSPLTRGKLGLANQGGLALRLIPAHAGKTYFNSAHPAHPWAHPRSRGENLLLGTPTPVALGSSPLTRGKLAALADRCRPCRLIPAHAGKTRA